MICPNCGADISDDQTVCPACRADLSQTRVMPKLRGRWCPSCGALVPDGASSCPKCGMPLGGAPETPVRAVEMEERQIEKERTATLPRIESAIPSEPDPQSESTWGAERMPRTRVFAVAALASLLVVGGVTLAITHPWDPSLTDTRATTPADTSQAGYPGPVTSISGQDSSDGAAPESLPTVDETTLAVLKEAYGSLGDLSSRADANEESFRNIATSGGPEERAAGKSDADQLAIEVSNLISKIQGVDVSSGTYAEDRYNLATLGSWLRNRVDALRDGWARSVESSDPAADAERIEEPVESLRQQNGKMSYANLFLEHYEEWEPVQK